MARHQPVQGGSAHQSEQFAEQIFTHLSRGGGLTSICRTLGISPTTVSGWVSEDREGFAARYARALRAQADAWANAILEIADAADPGTIKRARLRIEVRQWLLTKRHAATYANKVVIEEAMKPIRQIHDGMTLQEATDVYNDYVRNGHIEARLRKNGRARDPDAEAQAGALADGLLEIADGGDNDAKAVARDRLRIDACKWLLAKRYPSMYGDKVVVFGERPPEPDPITPEEATNTYNEFRSRPVFLPPAPG